MLVVFRGRVTRKQFRFISLGFQVHKTAVIKQHAQVLLFLELLDSFVLRQRVALLRSQSLEESFQICLEILNFLFLPYHGLSVPLCLGDLFLNLLLIEGESHFLRDSDSSLENNVELLTGVSLLKHHFTCLALFQQQR